MSKCNELSNELQNRAYKPQKGERHEVFEPKYRITVSSKYRDRVPQSSFVTNYFYPNVVPHLIENNCACIKDRGVDMAREKFKEILRNADMSDWCAATDMTGYFASIRHDSIYGEVGCYIHGWADWFYHATIENSSNPIGLDLGSEVYQLSATALPNRLDHILDDGGYIRYQDDLRYVGTKEKCLWMLNTVRAEAKRLGLTVSEKKTYIQPIKRPVRFLGFTFLRKPTGRVTMKRLPEKIRHERRKLRRMYKKGAPQDRTALHWQSVRECLKKGTRGDLHKMDKFKKGLDYGYQET